SRRIVMDRRTFLQGSLGATVAAVTSRAAAQSAASPPVLSTDTREVWLNRDTGPTDAAAMADRLATLAKGHGDNALDRYLMDGEVEALEREFATLLGKEDCAFLATGTLANN